MYTNTGYTQKLTCKKDEFLLQDDGAFLNCAYMAPLHRELLHAGIKGIYQKRAPHKITIQDFFEPVFDLKKTFSLLVHAEEPGRIAVISSVSYGMATVAKNARIGAGEKIIVAGEQFPSNVYPWLRLAEERHAQVITVYAPQTQTDRGKIWNERILDAIDNQTRMVCIGNIHWSDGTLFDLKALRERLDQVGGLLIIDGTQSVGAFPFDVRQIRPDALICAGYKWLLGPYGLGLAYYGPYFDDGVPLEENWKNRLNSEDFTGLVNYRSEYQPYAMRYDMGESSNFIAVPMLLKAIDLILNWEVDAIQDYCKEISAAAIPEIQSMGYAIEAPDYRSAHLFGIRSPEGRDIKQLKYVLDTAGISVSLRGDAIRVAPHLYNDKKDFDVLTECCKQALA